MTDVRRTLALSATLAVLAAGTVGIATLPGPMAVAVTAVLAGLVASLVVPLRAIALIWGALLPIYTVGAVPPIVFDLVRYGGVFVIGIRSKPSISTWQRRGLRWWIGMITAVGLAWIATSLARWELDSAFSGAVILGGLVSAVVIAYRPLLRWPVLAGYVLGATFSACVVLLQAAGLPNPTIPREGTLRHAGLSSTTTLLTYQLALSVVLAVAMWLAKRRTPSAHRIALLATASMLVAALLVSGGRGGILGLTLAGVLVGVRHRWIRPSHMIALVAVGGASWAAIQLLGARALTVDRLLPEDIGTVASRTLGPRAEVALRGLRAIQERPIFGPGFVDFHATSSLAPHFMPINFGITAGVIGLIFATVMVVRLGGVVLRRRCDPQPVASLGAALCAVLLANTMLEPSGPFSGVELITILLIALSMCAPQHMEPDADQESSVLPRAAREPGGLKIGQIRR